MNGEIDSCLTASPPESGKTTPLDLRYLPCSLVTTSLRNMNFIKYFIIFPILGLPSGIQAHEFTDSKGRKLEADILSVAGDQVTLRRKPDMKVFTVATNTFVESDQKLIDEWLATEMKYRFDVTYAKKKLGEVKKVVGPVHTEVESWAYEIKLKNDLNVPISDLRMDYWCFRRDDEGTGKVTAKIVTSGSIKIESMAALSTSNLTTSVIPIEKKELRGNYYFSNGDKDKQADGMGGFAVRIYDKNNKEIHSWATKDDLLAATRGKSTTMAAETAPRKAE